MYNEEELKRLTSESGGMFSCSGRDVYSRVPVISRGQISPHWCSVNIPSISPQPSLFFKQSYCGTPHLYVKPLLFDFLVISGTVLIFIHDVCLFKTGYCVNCSIGFKWTWESDRPKHRLEWRVEWATAAQGCRLSHAFLFTFKSSTHDPTCVYKLISFFR